MNRSIHPVPPGRRSLLAAVAGSVLALLVVGVPFWLVAAAGGPFVHLDPGALWQAAVRHRPGDVREVAGWLGRVAVLMAWLAWAWLTVCVVVEVRAWITGRSTVRLPASRTFQWAAALLVGTAFAIGAGGRVPVHRTSQVGIIGNAHPATPFAAGEAGRAATASGDHTVPRERSMQSPSESEPMHPTRVPELRDLQSTERYLSLPLPDPNRPDATPGDGVGHGFGPEIGHEVAPRDTLWSIAEARLGDPRRWREIADLNYGTVQFDGAALSTDHWVRPGWHLVLPGPPAREPTVETSTAVPSLPTVAIPEHSPDRTPVVDEDRSPVGGLPAVPLGAGIVGIGVADLLDRLRRVQQRHRRSGNRIRLPDQGLRDFEQRLRIGDGDECLDAIEAAVQAFFRTVESSSGMYRVHEVVVTADQVRLTFSSLPGDEVPAPFSAGADPNSVVVDRSSLAPAAAARRGVRGRFPLPTLVTVARDADELTMVNVEGVGSVLLAGDAYANEGVGRALALELATSRWASSFDLVLVGFGTGLERCERVAVVADPAPTIADLSWRRLTTEVRLDELGIRSADEARRTGASTDWQPMVVICGPAVPSGDADALVALAGDGRSGFGVVVINGSGPTASTGNVVLRPGNPIGAGLPVADGEMSVLQQVEATELGMVVALLDVARDLDEVDGDGSEQPDDEEASGQRTSAAFLDAPRESTARTDAFLPVVAGVDGLRADPIIRRLDLRGGAGSDGFEVEVAVLGPVEIRGAARGFTRAWAQELVVYLAMHPHGATNEAWATALWPDRLMAPSSLHSTASVARRSLGTARDGTDHLPRAHGRLALASTVGTDWTRFQVLAASDEPRHWLSALSLVRGRPFDGIRSADWSILDGTAPAMESAIVDLSGRLAGERLRAGDPRGAELSARKGLLASPYDERLYRMLLRAADAAGNPGGVESVMTELVRVVADEVEPIESVHPSTLALYRSLSRRTEHLMRGSAES